VANDIVYSFGRQRDLKVNASLLGDVKLVEAPSTSTVRITLNKPSADGLYDMTNPQNKIVAREAVEVKGDLKEGAPIGTGAFMLERWDKGTAMRFKRHPNYFIKEQPYIDELVVLVIPDGSTRLAAFTTKQALTTGPTDVPSKRDADQLKKNVP